MFSPVTGKKELKRLKGLIDGAHDIVATCHVKPDGDAIGSTLALCHVLTAYGKKVRIVTPDMPPRYLGFLPGFDDIVAYSADQELADRLLEDAGLIFCLDFNQLSRVDRMEDALSEAPAQKVMIDHHLRPESFPELTISSPATSSTCLLLFKTLCQLGLRGLIGKEAATCIAAGMMTDTGNFAYNANDPEAYIAMAELLEEGVNKNRVWEQLNIKSEQQLRLNGFAISERMKLYNEGRVAVMALSKPDLDSFNYRKGDLEGLVNVPLEIPEVEMSVLIHQEPGFVKISMRSQGKVPVNKMCERYFNGGGHLNASGGEFYGSIEETVDRIVAFLPEFSKYFRKSI